MVNATALSDRRALSAFVFGVLAVTAGVILHLPSFAMARMSGFRLSDMAMGGEMYWGMALIVTGIASACYGLLPRKAGRPGAPDVVVTPPEDAQLGSQHWVLMLVLVLALAIDIMKPASLGFTLPGMGSEYRRAPSILALVPFMALVGTVLGSVMWGALSDVYGRKATILLSAVMFVGTSICGAMPSLAWNAGMCFMMGLAAGGMLPVTYALLAEMMPSRHRGWSLVLVGGLGSVLGYLAASGASALLQPLFSWRILWLLNLPTGLALVVLGAFIPESAKFLLARGRREEAARVMQRFGSKAHERERPVRAPNAAPLSGFASAGKLLALSLAALCFGLVYFGLLLWLPGDLVAKGYSVELTSRLLAESALIAFPTIFVVALAYSAWSTKWSVVLAIAVMIAGLLGVLQLQVRGSGSPVVPVALLIVGSNALIAMLLPYAAESFPLRVRGRTTGTVAACSKAGGVVAQLLAILAIVPSLSVVTIGIIAASGGGLVLVAWFGRETRGRDLRDLDPDGHIFDGSGL